MRGFKFQPHLFNSRWNHLVGESTRNLQHVENLRLLLVDTAGEVAISDDLATFPSIPLDSELSDDEP